MKTTELPPAHGQRTKMHHPSPNRLLSMALACTLGGAEAGAQLAITEVMSYASITCCPETGTRGCHPDFWELTNFGSNTVDLTGYLFLDRDATFPEQAWRIPDGTIRPGESVIFVRKGWTNDVPDAAGFIRWWGEANLPADLQVFFYDGYIGFDDREDAVRLWDANSNIVDQVYFAQTRRGFTFIRDTSDGNYGGAVQSELGVCLTFQAAIGGDVGSPGYAPCGLAPLRITQQPVSQTNDAGSAVTFAVQAGGVPQPSGCEWSRNGAVVPNPTTPDDVIPTVVNYAGCGLVWKTSPKALDLTLPNVQPAHAGDYFVVLTNGLERLTSAVVTLTVNTNPMPPRIECPPPEWCFADVPGQPKTNLEVTLYQTAEFAVLARGFPTPTFRWSVSTDGTRFIDLPNATNRNLVINYVTPGNAGIYRVQVRNPHGTNSADARLTVKEPPPRLQITEVMSEECYGEANDWIELTNMGDEPVNLGGWRWDDGDKATIGGGPTVNRAVIVQPGESVILLEGRTPEFFIHWWGASNLPPRLQFITYTANGLEVQGDAITLWNPTATDNSDWLAAVSFSTATPGASFWFDTDACPSSWPGVVSLANQGGAFRSAQGCDVGSPGWTQWSPPCLTSVRRDGSAARLAWKAQPGSTTRVQYTRALASSPSATVWSDLGTYTFAGASCGATDATLGADRQRFYRVRLVAPANCPCPQ